MRYLLLFLVAVMAAAQSDPHQYSSDYRDDLIRTLNEGTRSLPGDRGLNRQWTPAQPLNGIDTLTFKKMTADRVPINSTCNDGVFLRRAALVLTGRLPNPELTRAFLADAGADKRARYIDILLESEAYETHWAFWYQEYFLSNQRFLRFGQSYYNNYFAGVVSRDIPLDQVARDLITSSGLTDESGPANFYVRARETGRLPQDVFDNFAIHAADKFLGVPLLCISCHDGAYHLEEINLYLAERKRRDLWETAAFFAGVRLRPGTRNDNDRPISFNVSHGASAGYDAQTTAGDRPPRHGGLVSAKYPFGGQVPPAAANLVEAFADYLVADRQFARNFANRFWGHAFGLAMVEPMDSFDPYRIDAKRALPEGWTHQALDLDLLEFMTDRFIEFGYSPKAYLRYVLNSATFQMDSEFTPGNWSAAHTPYYTRYMARRMTAESVYDSLQVAVGANINMPVNGGAAGRLDLQYAHQLPDNSQPRSVLQVNLFLQAFGRGNRDDIPRSNSGGVTQALLLMNSEVVAALTANPNNRLNQYVRSGYDADRIIDEIYLDVLCRRPEAEEKTALLNELAKYETSAEKASTVLWLLINRVEFPFIY